MKVACPGCGADVEFRYDGSFVRVCSHCNAAVLRSDRGIETLGKLADLVPLESSLKLFAEGHFGVESFLLVGMAQFRHASGGVWQEWYAKFSGGMWGWLAEAQGRLYLTFEAVGDTNVPAIESIAPGAREVLHGKTYAVGEVGEASYVSALGEIPYRLDPNARFRFADLSDGAGGFATVDYGIGAATPTLYVGQQVSLATLRISGGEAQPQLDKRVAGTKLACPNCNGALELRAPDVTLRIACPYCNTLVSVENGNLAIIAKLAHKPTLEIELGSKGTFVDGEFTVIGYLQRSAHIESTWYPFYEYLLYAPNVGFRWLVQSDGHWSYVQPIAIGAVEALEPLYARYDGVAFKLFQACELRVDQVFGEVYWQVEVGETVKGSDYIAPPAMLSSEATRSEENWSLSSYLTPAQVKAAFGKSDLNLMRPMGVAPNQPNRLKGMGWIAFATFIALLVGAFVGMSRASGTDREVQSAIIPPVSATPASPAGAGSDTDAPGTVSFSNNAFELDGDQNIEVHVSAPLNNSWAYLAVDLVHEASGEVVSFDTNLEYYSGVEDGEAWSEGSQSASQMLAPMAKGTYLLRVEGQQGGSSPLDVTVRVKQGVFRVAYFLLALLALGIPFGLLLLRGHSFEKHRWENSNV